MMFSSCAYYNYLYNAKEFYEDGELKRKEQTQTDKSSASKKNAGNKEFEKCIESTGRMLEYYPDSRWEDDALLLLAKAYYRIDQYRSSITKANELNLKYPDSPFATEGLLWKGMSLLKISQPDSAQRILSRLFGESIEADIKAQAHLALAQYYYDDERWELARESYRAVLDADPKDVWLMGEAWVKVGDCLILLKQFEEAEKLYDEIMSGKAPRRLKYIAKIERGVVLIELERFAEALESFEELLEDAAFLDLFPRVELEAGRCERRMGQYEQARDRFKLLTETETRGEIALHANYEYGNLLWNQWHDLDGARTAFESASKADRNSPIGKAADSLKTEMEQFYKHWQRLGFLERQLAALDSAQNGLLEMLPSDTVYVDSLKEKDRKSLKPESKRPRKPMQDRDDDAIARMVEEALENEAKEKLEQIDTTTIVVPDSSEYIDSTAVVDLIVRRHWELVDELFSCASFHLFDRNAIDSAQVYLHRVNEMNYPPFDSVSLKLDVAPEELWTRTVASLAYIARMDGKVSRSDSLLSLIIEKLPDSKWSNQAKQALGRAVSLQDDSLKARFMEAESVWRDDNKLLLARDLFYELVNIADSSSELRARSMLAAAYLSRRIVEEDTLALWLYAVLEDQFKNTLYSKYARDQKRIMTKDKNVLDEPEQDAEIEWEVMPDEEDDWDILRRDDHFESQKEEKVYLPDEVDYLPEMVTSEAKVDTYISSNYPFTAFSDGVEGMVELEFTIGTNGELYDIEVVLVEPEGREFANAARKVLEKLMYNPGRYHGRKVPVRLKQQFAFRL